MRFHIRRILAALNGIVDSKISLGLQVVQLLRIALELRMWVGLISGAQGFPQRVQKLLEQDFWQFSIWACSRNLLGHLTSSIPLTQASMVVVALMHPKENTLPQVRMKLERKADEVLA